MEYQKRLVCFIDLLGFKSAIDQTKNDDRVFNALYDLIHELKSSSIKSVIYGLAPVLSKDEKGDPFLKPAGCVYDVKTVGGLYDDWPVDITQFSDSYVLSCPLENMGSCSFLLKCVYLIHLMYFYRLGMMMRGGIAIGKVVHEENGALFGPAMNEAYALESKSAIYPRIIISSDAYNYINDNIKNNPATLPIFKSFDGHQVIDLISIFSWPEQKDPDFEYIDKHLRAIKDDVLCNAQSAHPKISYLLDRWAFFKRDVSVNDMKQDVNT